MNYNASRHENKPIKSLSLRCLCESGYFSLGTNGGHCSIPLIIEHAELRLTKAGIGSLTPASGCPIHPATGTTKVLVQHVTPPKYNLVGLLYTTLVSSRSCSTLYVQQEAGFVTVSEQIQVCNEQTASWHQASI